MLTWADKRDEMERVGWVLASEPYFLTRHKFHALSALFWRYE